MRFLSRFFGSNRDVQGPDISRAPWLEVDYSGTKLRFKNPPHTAMYPTRFWPSDADIFDANSKAYEGGEHARGYSLAFYDRGWNLWGAGRKSVGGVTSRFALCFYAKLPQSLNLFDKKQFEELVIENSLKIWGGQNKGAKAGHLGEGSLVFPVRGSDLKYETLNGVDWCRIEGGAKGTAPEFIYTTALTPKHLLFVSLHRQTYGGIDFYSPETNIEAVSNQFVSDFMNNFFITPSEEVKAQREAAGQRESGARDADVASSL